jgi:hypothetical protein
MPTRRSPSERHLEVFAVNHHWKWLAGLLCLLLIGGVSWLWYGQNNGDTEEESDWVWPETPREVPPPPSGPLRPPRDVPPPRDITRLKLPPPPTDGPPPLPRELKLPPPPLLKDRKLPGRS